MYDYVHPNSVSGRPRRQPPAFRPPYVDGLQDRPARAARSDWRLGGKQTTSPWPRAPSPAWQHDARRNPDETLSIFDNGAAGTTVTHKSRGSGAPPRRAGHDRRPGPRVPRPAKVAVDQSGQHPPDGQRRLLRRLGRPAGVHRVRERRHRGLRRPVPVVVRRDDLVVPGAEVPMDGSSRPTCRRWRPSAARVPR